MSTGVVQNMLRSCKTMYMQVQLLKLLCHSKFGFGFTILGEQLLVLTLLETVEFCICVPVVHLFKMVQ